MRFSLAVLAFFVVPAITPLAAQRASVRGTVTDTAKAPVEGVEVLVTPESNDRSKNPPKPIARATTDSLGRFTFSDLPANQPLSFTARKLGYTALTSDPITLKENETQELAFRLEKAPLVAVKVTARRNAAYHIDSTAIAKLPVRDALGVILNYRQRMLGDVYKMCAPDTSHLTYGDPHMYRAPLKFWGGDPSHYLPQFRLYINGIWHGERSAKDILASIDVDDIAEMNYVDCNDKDMPELRNSLLVVLKPGKSY